MVERKNARRPAARKRPVGAAKSASANVRSPAHDLLCDPIFTVRDGPDRFRRNLPEILALLAAKRINAFPALQAFQQHAWHAFLVQLAAMAIHRVGESDPQQPSDRWAELLLDMTGGEREPWCLVVGDLEKPAFMQPPVPEGVMAEFKNAVERPDLMDVLVLSKNHDVKMGRMDRPELEHWIFALISMQTMQGYSGAGNHGIARMNGGYGSRPGIGIARRLEPGWRFARDVRRLLDDREALLENHQLYEPTGGAELLWLEPWDGIESRALSGLDPYFIEVCRRVRMVEDQGRMRALLRTTKASRLAASELAGVTGDPWTPVSRAKSTAFTSSDAGFTYRVIQRLLSDEFMPGLALQPGREDGDSILTAEVLARGQGQTNGFHHRALEVPAKVVRRLATEHERKTLAAIAKDRVELAANVQRSVLLPALLCLLQGDPEKPRKLDYKDGRPRRWLDAFDDAVDARFFERLWADLDRPEAEAREDWERLLLDLARSQLNGAIEAAPVPAARRYRAIAGGERMFHACERKHFKHLFEPEGERV